MTGPSTHQDSPKVPEWPKVAIRKDVMAGDESGRRCQVSGDFMKEWAERCAANYQAQVERGEHDEQCEHDVRGFYLCHCSKRRREAAGFTEPPTDNLEFPPPCCPRCDEELTHEEGWRCFTCSLSWDSDGDGRSAAFTDTFGDDLAADAERWRSKRKDFEQVGGGQGE